MNDQLYLKIADDYNGTIELLAVDGPATIYNAKGVKRFCDATKFAVCGRFTPIFDLVWATRPQYRSHRGVDMIPFYSPLEADDQFVSF